MNCSGKKACPRGRTQGFTRRRAVHWCPLRVVLLWSLTFSLVQADEMARVLLLRADGVTVYFSAELALTEAERSRGLMYRTTLGELEGMWFDFETDAEIAMWMKNTLLPLDMLFINRHGTVVSVHERARPQSTELIRSPGPVRYVLELPAGTAGRFDIGTGASARLLRAGG